MKKNIITLIVLVSLVFSFQLFAADEASSTKEVVASEQSMQEAPVAEEESEPLDVRWKNFEFNLNYITQAGGSYSVGAGFVYTPFLKDVIKSSFYDFSFAPRLGLQLAKGSAGGVFPILQLAVGVPYMFNESTFLAPHLGFGSAMESGSSSAFALLGFDLGSMVETVGFFENVVGFKWINRYYLRYTAMLSDSTTHQLELGVGFEI